MLIFYFLLCQLMRSKRSLVTQNGVEMWKGNIYILKLLVESQQSHSQSFLCIYYIDACGIRLKTEILISFIEVHSHTIQFSHIEYTTHFLFFKSNMCNFIIVNFRTFLSPKEKPWSLNVYVYGDEESLQGQDESKPGWSMAAKGPVPSGGGLSGCLTEESNLTFPSKGKNSHV